MIQSISSNKITKINNYADAKSKPVAQISFTGINVSKVGREIIGDTGSKAEKKVAILAEETVGLVKRVLKKTKGKNELPYSEKPVTCNMPTNDKIEAESQRRAAESVQVNAYRKETIQKIKDSGNNVAAGDVDAYGHPTSQGQHKIDNPTSTHRKHHEDFNNESSNKTSFRGQTDDDTSAQINKIQNSPWLNQEEKAKEINELMAQDGAEHHLENQAPHPIWEKLDNSAQGFKHSDTDTPEVVSSTDHPKEEEEKGFFHKLWNSFFGDDDINGHPDPGPDDDGGYIDIFKF